MSVEDDVLDAPLNTMEVIVVDEIEDSLAKLSEYTHDLESYTREDIIDEFDLLMTDAQKENGGDP